jgi:lipoprotein-releasing system permease protein
MAYERFIAFRILTGKGGSGRLTNPVIRISIAGIALGMAVMIIAVMVVTGFRKEISEKVTGFGSHIRVSHFNSNNSYEDAPIVITDTLLQKLAAVPGVRHMQLFASKAGIIKTDEEIQGVVLKGVTSGYDGTFFKNRILKGAFPRMGKQNGQYEIMISKKSADQLFLKKGDDLLVYFIEQPPRIRKITISGIYETGLDEFDQVYAFCDIELIRQLNNWDDDQAGGIEILVDNTDRLEPITDDIYYTAGFEYTTRNIREQYPQIFHWLDLQNINVAIIITLILLVAGISMISTLLIIILENNTLIGILKALGATNVSIRKIFIYLAIPIIGIGMVAGNLLGAGMCLFQLHTGFITLPQESYYVARVPVNFSILHLMLLNAGTLLICLFLLLGPSMVITRILPARVIRFD